jgi:hypothetical protein
LVVKDRICDVVEGLSHLPFSQERLPPTFDLVLVQLVYINLLLDVKVKSKQALETLQVMFDKGTRIQGQLHWSWRPLSPFLMMVSISS